MGIGIWTEDLELAIGVRIGNREYRYGIKDGDVHLGWRWDGNYSWGLHIDTVEWG